MCVCACAHVLEVHVCAYCVCVCVCVCVYVCICFYTPMKVLYFLSTFSCYLVDFFQSHLLGRFWRQNSSKNARLNTFNFEIESAIHETLALPSESIKFPAFI